MNICLTTLIDEKYCLCTIDKRITLKNWNLENEGDTEIHRVQKYIECTIPHSVLNIIHITFKY